MGVRDRLSEHSPAASGIHDFDVCPTPGKGFQLQVLPAEPYERGTGRVAYQGLGRVIRDGTGGTAGGVRVPIRRRSVWPETR
jgi:hypothetical protein